MGLEYSAEDQPIRAEVREFLATLLPEGLRRKVENGVELQRDDIMSWHRILHAKGWAAPNWPAEYGGPQGGHCHRNISLTKNTPWPRHRD